MACFVQDDSNSTLQGLARISCVANDPAALPSGPLATIVLRPQPFVYTQLRPNQGNGVLAIVSPRNCFLSDLQGIAHPMDCEGAAVTFRYLEGDVAGPDCAVNATDIQAVSSRLGTRIGSLRYASFYDVEPSPRGDGDIDIRDVQFVYGRYGSTCAAPRPPQPPLVPLG
jgi:hypothetical protein